ncbi:hemicentin-1-like isoform X3 [Girardinichthys multiradiatus]|uniref:hemicentin-1-like isoform X3 n=1 Tax=Girardinichthys multiradiatus TaxID=208333 RepID=UPI001FADC165|nr:hemicentin-1-like isoform X3 [Girardinichthys multiradiatus]
MNISTCAVGPSCDGRQDGAQCYGALGGAVDLMLVDNVSEIPRFNWRKNSSIILRWRNSIVYNTKESRFIFFPSNGTVRISNLIRTDSGEYKLELNDKDGKVTGRRTLQLYVQAPVSSVQLVSECLSQGQMKVSCLSEERDSPQYSWTLDGHILTDSELLSKNYENNIIVLRQNISGHLICSVRSQVSYSFNQMNISTCVGPSCDGRQDETQCYGALGGAVDLMLVDNVSEIPRFNWRKNSSIILRWRNSIVYNTKESRFIFFPSNGTVRISNLIRTDSGEYKLELNDKDGKVTGRRTLQLYVQAPVSSVQLVSECLSQGQMKVSCLSEERDSPQYSWTLDGHILTDSELLSKNYENNIIVLRQNISGHLICSVRSQVSYSFNQMNISTCAVGPSCDGRQDETQCYGALGGAVDLMLVDNVSEIPRFNWRKNSSIILRWRNSIVYNTKESRFLFFPSNGTVRISNLIRTDSGEYKLELNDKDGKVTGRRTLQLYVQAPVSSVQLVSECLSQGQMKVSCLSEERDSPQYSWTLDGHILTDSELLSKNYENNIIVLRQNISGHLICSVRNQVSYSFNQMNISGCGLSHLLILGLRATVVILPLIGMSLYFTWRRKKCEKAEDSAVSQIIEDLDNSILMIEMKSPTH